MKKIHLKIVSVLAAIILWFIVITVENSVYAVPGEFPVTTVNQEKNVALTEPLPGVKIYVTAQEQIAQGLNGGDFEVTVDLRNTVIGDNILPVKGETKKNDIRVLKTVPSEVAIRLAPLTKKEVKVQLRVNGQPAPSYLMEQVTSETETVTISGAQNVLDAIEYVEAELILDGTQRENVSQSVPVKLRIINEQLTPIVTIGPEEIFVEATIASEVKEKEVTIIPGFRNDQEKLAWESQITVSPAKVVVRGAAEALENMTSIQTAVFELSAVNRGREIEVPLELPQGVTLADPAVTITIFIPAPSATTAEPTPPSEPDEESIESGGF